ncbi:MAG: hypothetical protein HY810_08700 [Candidatus Omnitrophica bacterium]|nr:hypothetical protein [Candidatus Omnitrophota bacterium]
MDKRWRVIFIASCFAFLAEYALRGCNHFLRFPFISLLVFLNYFTYLVLIEDFIGRFKLKDYQVWIVAQFFGLLWQLISVAGVYYPIPPVIVGISFRILFINNLVWWTTLQTVFALYIGHRLNPDVDRSKPLLSKPGIFWFFTAYVLISTSFRLLARPPVTAWQFFVMLTLTLIFARFFRSIITSNIKNKVEPAPFKPNKFLDVLACFMVLFFLVLFFFLPGTGHNIHPLFVSGKAVRPHVIITTLAALGLLLNRIVSKKQISV